MSEQVKVEDLEVFRLFRAALLKFAQAAGESLSHADGEISRTHTWLENEQATYWQGQIRKRTEMVAAARDALRQKKLFKDSTGRTPNAIQEEKALAQCLAALEHAQAKFEAVRKWLPKLEKAAELYSGGVSRLQGTVTGDIPKAVALLDRLAETLEEYVQIEAPAGHLPDSVTTAPAEESLSRGGEAAPELPPKTVIPPSPAPAATVPDQSTTAAAHPADTPSPKEGDDVTGGK